MSTRPGDPDGDLAPLNERQRAEVQHYLLTGDHDSLHFAWEGGVFERCRRGSEALVTALLAEVTRRARGKRSIKVPPSIDLQRLTRSKVEPMVRGLFPRVEQDAVLAVLERSIVFVTRDNLEAVLRGINFLSTAWRIANLYLSSVGAEVSSDDADRIVGLSEETTCWVSTEYFHPGGDRFADFIVHETAHIFHNCKRETVGLPQRGRREWLLEIDFRSRETFAYACEAYGRILELGARPADRRRLLDELLEGPLPPDDRVDENKYHAALTEAVSSRNGWKRILLRCAPERRPRRPS